LETIQSDAEEAVRDLMTDANEKIESYEHQFEEICNSSTMTLNDLPQAFSGLKLEINRLPDDLEREIKTKIASDVTQNYTVEGWGHDVTLTTPEARAEKLWGIWKPMQWSSLQARVTDLKERIVKAENIAKTMNSWSTRLFILGRSTDKKKDLTKLIDNILSTTDWRDLPSDHAAFKNALASLKEIARRLQAASKPLAICT